MDADQGLRLLGNYSKWQIRSYLMYAFGFGVPFAWMWMAIIFIGDTPAYHCNLKPNSTLNESIPDKCDDMGKCELDQCYMYSNFSYTNETVQCQDGYWYDPASGYESTIVSEFNLVCGKNWLVELSMTMKGIGAIIGAFLFPLLSDAFGRKKIFLLCMWTNALSCFIQAFSVNMWMFSIFGFIDGTLQQGMVMTAFVLSLELFPTEQRTFAGVAVEFFWSLGYMSLVPMAYFLRNWRHLQIAITAPLVLTILFYWYLAESIPWLIVKGRRQQAEDILQKAAKFSGVTLPNKVFTSDSEGLMKNEKDNIPDYDKENVDQDTKQTAKDENLNIDFKDGKGEGLLSKFVDKGKENDISEFEESGNKDIIKYSIWDLMKSKKIVLYTLVQCFMWFVNSIGYNAIAFTVTFLPGDRYLNFFLYAVMEIPAYALMWLSLYYLGRRITIASSHIVGGLTLLGMIAQLYDSDEKLTPLVILLSVVGKMGFCISYGAIYVQTPELYPTSIRNTGMGICGVFSKAATLISPYFRVLSRIQPVASPVIIGVASIIAGLLSLILPETRYETLPDTIEEVEGFTRSYKKKTEKD